jgi:pimeloyl-ACP methyl ester carboxylesterase
MMTITDLATEKQVQLETVKARYFETGQGYPTIFLHGVGFLNGGETWLPCIKEGLGNGIHVYAADMLGWGAGERPTWNYSFPYWVDHVRELQDVLGLEKTNIVGHSLGGWVAATFAYESPNRVNKLVLVANAGLNPQPPANLANFQPPTREQVAQGLANYPDPEMRDLLIEQRWRNASAPDAAAAFGKINENLHDFDMRHRYFLRRRLGKISVPTMIVYGENDTGYPVDPMGKELHASIPGSRFEVVANSGHFIPTDQPAALTGLIRDFLVE